MTQGQARRMAAAARNPWNQPVPAATTAPLRALSAPVTQVHLSDLAAMEAVGEGGPALALRMSILHESHDGSPIRGAIVTLEAPRAWFDSDPRWHVLDRGSEEGWTLAVDPLEGRATFTYAGILGHGGSTGVTAHLGLEPGTSIAGLELTLTATIVGGGEDRAPSVRRLTVA